MILPSANNYPCAIATAPTEVLLTILDHLDLEDVFVARYVCKAFHANALYVWAGRKKQHQLDHPEDKFKYKTWSAFRIARGKANFFYEATHPRKLNDYFCNHCLQIKEKKFFSDDYSSQRRPRAHRQQLHGRFCWMCYENLYMIFRLNHSSVFVCGGPGHKEPTNALFGYWKRSSPHVKICVACWPAYKGSLEINDQTIFKFRCGCMLDSKKCEGKCGEMVEQGKEEDAKRGSVY